MKKVALLSTIAAFCLGLTFVSADEKAAEAKVDFKTIKCPVSGGPAKEASAVDYKGGKVYFCCNNCPKAFAEKTKDKENKDGIVLMQKANAQLVATHQTEQLKCPIAGKPLNKEKHTTVAGAEVVFCCDGCKGKVEKATGDDQIALIFNEKTFADSFKVKTAKKSDKKESGGLKGLKKRKKD